MNKYSYKKYKYIIYVNIYICVHIHTFILNRNLKATVRVNF